MSQELIQKAKAGFATVNINDTYKEKALVFLEQWLSEPMFIDYVPQITHMIEEGHWDYLLDCFYQIIPFGTGGRRGEVGIGPNRINPWTIQSSAQGHSQYLIKQFGDDAKTRGVVLAFDVREFFTNKYFSDTLPNPVRNLNCQHLAKSAAEVYTANGIKVFIFDTPRTTPELSFAIRYLKCVGGDMFSASHNPPEHNGKKVYDQYGGQLIPPEDETLVKEVTENVKSITTKNFDEALNAGLVEMIGEKVDLAYVDAVSSLSLTSARDIKIVFTPLHGCGSTSVAKVLTKLGFEIHTDPKTANQSGKFENVTFNIPNPEVIQSFDTSLEYAKSIDADIILNSDPDADRIGIMVKHQNGWQFLNGNEIGAVLTQFAVDKLAPKLKGKGIIIKTDVTTNLISEIAKENDLEIYGNLLVGFKYIGEIMNQLEKEGKIDDFLFGCEESHGYIAGNYVRDKDAAVPGMWLAELCADLKTQNLTLVDYLNKIYAKYGYFRNYLTEIRLPGAEGMSQIQAIQTHLRSQKPTDFGSFKTISYEDWLERLPIVSETDRSSKNGIVIRFSSVNGTKSIRVSVRPSGTEPKIKMYFEIGSTPFELSDFEQTKKNIDVILKELEKEVMLMSYRAIGIDFPERGFLLFWQLPLTSKLKYFEIEDDLAALSNEPDNAVKKTKMDSLLAFLGSDPLQKINDAFKAKYGKTVQEYLNLEA